VKRRAANLGRSLEVDTDLRPAPFVIPFCITASSIYIRSILYFCQPYHRQLVHIEQILLWSQAAKRSIIPLPRPLPSDRKHTTAKIASKRGISPAKPKYINIERMERPNASTKTLSIGPHGHLLGESLRPLPSDDKQTTAEIGSKRVVSRTKTKIHQHRKNVKPKR